MCVYVYVYLARLETKFLQKLAKSDKKLLGMSLFGKEFKGDLKEFT